MKAFTPLNPALLALVASSYASTEHNLVPRASTPEYLTSICSPNITSTHTGPLPPCIAINNIETACQPNGTSSLAMLAHAQCMCAGSFFADWKGCQQCLFFHGGLSEREVAAYGARIDAASAALCTGTPSAVFQTLFAAVTPSAVTTGATTTGADQKSGDTAVSLYYTPSGSQGPGQVTGSATGATATGPRPTGGAGSSTSGGGSSPTSGAGAAGSSSTTNTPNVAAPTGVVVAHALAIAGALAVAL